MSPGIGEKSQKVIFLSTKLLLKLSEYFNKMSKVYIKTSITEIAQVAYLYFFVLVCWHDCSLVVEYFI